MALKILHGAKLAQDLQTGDIYVLDCCGGPINLTDARKLRSIAVTTAPTKTSYYAGETFDATGMVVTATYDDGSKSEVSGYGISPSGALATTDTKVTVTYRGKTATQNITVSAVVLSSIAITTAPTKTTYTAGETFDATGMVVTATYNNGDTAVVTTYTTSPTAPLTTDDTSVTVSYAEEGVTKTATQAIIVTGAGE